MHRTTAAALAALLSLAATPAALCARPTRTVPHAHPIAAPSDTPTRAHDAHLHSARLAHNARTASSSSPLRTSSRRATYLDSAHIAMRLDSARRATSLNPHLARRHRTAAKPASALAIPAPALAPPALTSSIADAPLLSVSSLYAPNGRLIVPAPLFGSHEILLHQNAMANHEGLARVRDDADLLDLLRTRQLVPLPGNQALRVDQSLPLDRRYSRPWTAAFLAVLARDFFSSFHSALQVDSAVRTVSFQRSLARTNGNAAPATGDTASPHLTGQAVDIAKGNLSRAQIAWLRTYLSPLIHQGKIDVEEEFQQACFHISVYQNYLPASAVARIGAVAHPLESQPIGALAQPLQQESQP